jgi:hypothetical protein
VTEHIVRSGLAFGFLVLAVTGLVGAAVSVPVRWARNRGGRG